MTVSKTIQLGGYQPGVTDLTLDVLTYNGVTTVASALAFTETAVGSGVYNATLTAVVTTATYRAKIKRGGSVIGGGLIDLEEVAGAYEIVDAPSARQVAGLITRDTYNIQTIVDVITTAGSSAHIKAMLVTVAGQLVNLADLDPDATCTVTVIRDGDVPQFSMDESDMGSPNGSGFFEADYDNPNFDTDTGYTVLTTIVADGQTYEDRVDSFNVWP